MCWPPPADTSVSKFSSGARRESLSRSQLAAASASVSSGQRAMTSRPPFLRRRSTVSKIGDGSTTNNSLLHGTTGAVLPRMVLHCLCARRSMTCSPFFALVAAKLSTLGPRSEFTEPLGSTGLSQSQQTQLSCSPMAFRSLMNLGYGNWGRP